MRWRCGDNVEEWRATWNWHRWFAWHPVCVEGRLRWLRTVERRRDDDGVDIYGPDWEYRLP